ncbi:MAG: TldD/PmbA family protein [Candidatus Heimdallarchaeaceae archaeon]
MYLIDYLDKLITSSHKLGAKYTDVRYGRVEQKRIQIEDGKIIQETNCLDSGYGIRTLSEGIITFTSVPKLDFAENEIRKIMRISSQISKWKKGISELTEVPIAEATVVREPKVNWKDLEKEDMEEKINILSKIIGEKLRVKAKIEIDISFIDWFEHFLSSEGSNITQKFPYAILTITGRTMHNSIQTKFNKPFGGMGGIEILPFEEEEKIEQFVEVVNNIPTARKIKKGKYKAVLCEDMTWTLVHEVLGHSLEADNVLSGRSFSSGLLGRKIAPSNVSVIDDPYLETLGYYEYDSEGTKGRGTLLVDEGILTDFLHSRITAAAMGTESSSNYRASSFEFLPQVRMSNIFIEPKNSSFEELLETTRNGIYIGDGLSGSSEPQTGEYNLDAQFGRIIENGELSDFIMHFQISGKMIETLSKIELVGDTLLSQPGSCVKNNQRIYVGSVSPKISILETKVS